MSVSTLTALFIEGVLSFFSPCVLPLIPVYMSYLSQGAKTSDENGNIIYKKSKVMVTTLFFVLGISSVFFIIALSVASFQSMLDNYSMVVNIVVGMILIFFGLLAMKVVEIPFLNRNYKLPFNLDVSKMSFLNAYIFGFLFSFSWSPCIGPMLASAIFKAASASSRFEGIAYICVYTLGFILMFILLGLFTESVLDLLKKHQKLLVKTGILAGLIIIWLGVRMIYQSSKEIIALKNATSSVSVSANTESRDIDKFNFTLKNGEGQDVSLNDFLGKTVVVTFYGTWCPYCNQELPSLEKINNERDDVAVVLIATPNDGRETSIEGVEAFMKEKGYTLEVLYDETYSVKSAYGVNGYPTSFIYKPDGSMLGYLPGYVSEDVLMEVIEQSKN